MRCLLSLTALPNFIYHGLYFFLNYLTIKKQKDMGLKEINLGKEGGKLC